MQMVQNLKPEAGALGSKAALISGLLSTNVHQMPTSKLRGHVGEMKGTKARQQLQRTNL